MRSISTQKLMLCWNTTFRPQVKHTVTLPERQFAMEIWSCTGRTVVLTSGGSSSISQGMLKANFQRVQANI